MSFIDGSWKAYAISFGDYTSFVTPAEQAVVLTLADVSPGSLFTNASYIFQIV